LPELPGLLELPESLVLAEGPARLESLASLAGRAGRVRLESRLPGLLLLADRLLRKCLLRIPFITRCALVTRWAVLVRVMERTGQPLPG
jgi:hypothetical protein